MVKLSQGNISWLRLILIMHPSRFCAESSFFLNCESQPWWRFTGELQSRIKRKKLATFSSSWTSARLRPSFGSGSQVSHLYFKLCVPSPSIIFGAKSNSVKWSWKKTSCRRCSLAAQDIWSRKKRKKISVPNSKKHKALSEGWWELKNNGYFRFS